MKYTAILSLATALMLGTGFSANAQVKVGTVDMNKIFSGYYKTKDAESRINVARSKAKQEFDDKMDALKKEAEEIKKVQDEMINPALSKDARDGKQKTLDEKLAKFRPAERELKEFQTTQEKQLQEQAVRMRNGIVEEITKLINDKVKTEQFDIVLDRSGNSLNGVPIMVFGRESLDFSEEIITQLNKSKPKDTATTGTAAPAATKKP